MMIQCSNISGDANMLLRSAVSSLRYQQQQRQQEQRSLSYLNVRDDDVYTNAWDHTTVDTLLITFYSLLTVAFALIAYFTIRVVCNTREFQEWMAMKYLLPAVSVFMALECATLSVDEAIPTIPSVWAEFLYVLEATIAPGMFLSTFVVTFLAYRIRSMPFCCVRRRHQAGESSAEVVVDSSTSEEPLVQPKFLIVGMNVFAFVLLIVSVGVNFDALWSESDLAGRTGWMTLLLEPWEPSFVHVGVALIPMTIVCCVCLYFAGVLFRYGNEFSMTIYSSFLNPWMWPLVGVVAVFGGILPPYPWFALTSNMGICVYHVTILRVLFEIRQDLGEATEFGSYLRACWETPAGVDATTTEAEVVDEPPPPLTKPSPAPAERSGILKESSKKEGAIDRAELLGTTLL